VNKSGAWYAKGNERIGQGRENAIQYLKDHPEMMAEVEADIRAKLGLKAAAEQAARASANKPAAKPAAE